MGEKTVPESPEVTLEGAPPSVQEALTSDQIQAQTKVAEVKDQSRDVRADLGQEVEGAQAEGIVAAVTAEAGAPSATSSEGAKESSPWGALLSGILAAKSSIMDFLSNVGAQIRDGIAKLFGLKEKGEEAAKEAVQKVLDILHPNAPIFSFPKEWVGAAVNPIVSDVRRIRPEHKVTHKKNVPHEGVDIALPEGTPIVMTTKATIIKRTKGDSAGNYVTVRLEDGTEVSFMHLQKPGPVEETVLEPGSVLGYVGSTGGTTGPHLHFEVNGGRSDPLPYVDPSLKSSADSLVAQLQEKGEYRALA